MPLQKFYLQLTPNWLFLQYIQNPLLGQFIKPQKPEVVFSHREHIRIYSFLKDQIYDHSRGKISEQLETSYHNTIIP